MACGPSSCLMFANVINSCAMKTDAARCWFAAVLLHAALPGDAAQDAQLALTNSPVLLTNIQQVVTLDTNTLASALHRARVRGVIIYVSAPTRRLYVQDGDECVQANLTNSVRGFHPGQVVQVEGSIVAGVPFPRILGATANLLGEASLPEAKASSAGRLASGQDAFRLVSARGIVRDMTSDRSVLTLLLTDEWRAFELALPLADARLPREWIDAEIEARGTAYPFYNSRNQPNGFRLHSQSLDFVRVITPGVTNLFDRPVMTIAEASRQPWDWQRRL